MAGDVPVARSEASGALPVKSASPSEPKTDAEVKGIGATLVALVARRLRGNFGCSDNEAVHEAKAIVAIVIGELYKAKG